MPNKGQVPKQSNGADCKSAGLRLPRCESLPAHQSARLAQLVRASRLHREGLGFESLNVHHAVVAQLVEQLHGKEQVRGSSPRNGLEIFFKLIEVYVAR